MRLSRIFNSPGVCYGWFGMVRPLVAARPGRVTSRPPAFRVQGFKVQGSEVQGSGFGGFSPVGGGATWWAGGREGAGCW